MRAFLFFCCFLFSTAAAYGGSPEADGTAGASTQKMSSAGPELYPELASLFELYQHYSLNLSPYEPVYFLVGTNPEESKFQLSFKYRFFNPEGPLATRRPWVRGFYLAYTQTSFWNLRSSSAPFEDTSYKPEIFYLSSNLDRPSWMQGFFVQTGYQHESNGRDDELSRSTNFLYAKPIVILYNPDRRIGLLLGTKVWTYVNGSQRDFADYRGYFEVEIKMGHADGWVMGSYLRWAKKGASVQVDLTYPAHKLFFGNLDIYFQVQYVNALAENLIDYRERTEALRLGIAVVR